MLIAVIVLATLLTALTIVAGFNYRYDSTVISEQRGELVELHHQIDAFTDQKTRIEVAESARDDALASLAAAETAFNNLSTEYMQLAKDYNDALQKNTDLNAIVTDLDLQIAAYEARDAREAAVIDTGFGALPGELVHVDFTSWNLPPIVDEQRAVADAPWQGDEQMALTGGAA